MLEQISEQKLKDFQDSTDIHRAVTSNIIVLVEFVHTF